MRELLLAELRRAVQLLEDNPELAPQKAIKMRNWQSEGYHDYFVTDRSYVELEQLLKAIRRHSLAFQKQSRGKL